MFCYPGGRGMTSTNTNSFQARMSKNKSLHRMAVRSCYKSPITNSSSRNLARKITHQRSLSTRKSASPTADWLQEQQPKRPCPKQNCRVALVPRIQTLFASLSYTQWYRELHVEWSPLRLRSRELFF